MTRCAHSSRAAPASSARICPKRCSTRGHEVVVLDNLSTGSIDNIAHLKGRAGFDYHIDSVDNEPLLAELIDRADVVFHFAAAVGVKLIVEQPVHTIETNVHGTEVVLKHANKKKKLVVIASTSEVYGKSEDVPFREDSDLVLGPTPKHRWAYACSKAIDEFLALAYWKERKLPVIIVRFFNTVGPRQTGRYGMVIPNFVRQALAGEPITVFGDGTQCALVYARRRRRPRADGAGGRAAKRSDRSSTSATPRKSRFRRLAERVKRDLDRFDVADQADSVRRGLRIGLRGHAAPAPRSDAKFGE